MQDEVEHERGALEMRDDGADYRSLREMTGRAERERE
jgi:hypothetical protein